MTAREDLVAAAIQRISRDNFPAAELDDLKALPQLPPDYAEVHLSTRTAGPARAGALGHRLGWRLQIRVNAKTVGNAQHLLGQVHDDLYDRVLTAGGRTTTLLDEEPSDVPASDDGWYSALLSFTFTY